MSKQLEDFYKAMANISNVSGMSNVLAGQIGQIGQIGQTATSAQQTHTNKHLIRCEFCEGTGRGRADMSYQTVQTQAYHPAAYAGAPFSSVCSHCKGEGGIDQDNIEYEPMKAYNVAKARALEIKAENDRIIQERKDKIKNQILSKLTEDEIEFIKQEGSKSCS